MARIQPKPLRHKERPSVFEYIDFRVFLQDYYEYLKSLDKRFTYSVFSSRATLNSRNYMKLIITGQRNITKVNLKKIARACDLNSDEGEYFKALVEWNQCSKATDLEQKWNHVLMHGRLSNETKYLKNSSVKILTTWQAVAILEMVRLKGFQANAEWIKDRFREQISEEQIGEIFDLLIKEGLIQEKDGQFEVIASRLELGGKIPSKLIKMYHYNLAQAAGRAVMSVAPNEREFAATTLTIHNSQIDEIKAEIRKCYKKITDICATDKRDPDDVYQVNFQFFPLTKEPGSSEGGEG